MNMHKLFAVAALLVLAVTAQAQAVFNWAQPATLTPSFPAPNADNRYGEYISMVKFTDKGVTLTVDDSGVMQQSQKARFLYGYNTQVVEMRAYAGSFVRITPPEGYEVKSVTLEGAKVGGEYIYSADWNPENGVECTTTGTTTVWTWRTPKDSIELTVYATINCTSTSVQLSQKAGVDGIEADPAAEAVLYTLQGVRVQGVPAEPGLYLRRSADGRVIKTVVR